MKAETVLSSGVEHVNDGFTYCTPKIILMCGCSFYIHTSSRGLSASNMVANRLRRDLGYEPPLSYRKANSARKAPKIRSG